MITLASKRYTIAAYGTTLDSRYPGGGAAGFTPEAGFEVSGTFVDGGTATVTKAAGGFGTKIGGASTLFFDTVSSYYANGVASSPWAAYGHDDAYSTTDGPWSAATPSVTIDRVTTYASRSASYKMAPSAAQPVVFLDNWKLFDADVPSGIGTLYVAWRYRCPVLPLETTSCKFLRVWDTTTGAEDAYRVSWTYYHMTASIDAGSAVDYTRTKPPTNTWALMEMCHDFNLTTAVGTVTRRLNSAALGGLSGTIGIEAALPSAGIVPRAIGFDPAGGTWENAWVAYGAYDGMPVHIAEIYADYSPQRLEISDSGVSPYATSARAFQVVTDWADAQISATLLQGEHSSLSGKYLWWFDAANSPSLVGQFQ